MRHIFLTGLPGSGKSTAGRLLAQRLGIPVFDVDMLIEASCGERIPDIFARYGEAYFRVWETRMLDAAIHKAEHAVIVTGGGCVIQAENRRLMQEHGVRVYLQVSPDTAIARLQAYQQLALAQGALPEIRPLLSGPDPLAALKRLLAGRAAWYEEAEYTCSTEHKPVEQVVEEVIAMLADANDAGAGSPIIRHVAVGQGYDVIVDWDGLVRLPHYLARLHLPSRVFLITDRNVEALYALPLIENLKQADFEAQLYVLPAGESSKSQQQLTALYDWLIEQHAERSEALIALGGGVVGDLVGFAAATYLRGVPLVHVPTSLLAQVDSAIGGKTGINHARGKNLIGAFYHPRLVLADPSVLLSLPDRVRIEGWAEVVKYGIILDAALFDLLELHAGTLRGRDHPPVELLCQIIARCIHLKASVIEEDEREQERRAILNYGHTVGHALENVSGYGELLHGEAVSLGMMVAARLAHAASLFSSADVERQQCVLEAFGLPTVYHGSVRAQDILAAIQLDKKVIGKRVRWILPQHIGEVVITSLPDELVTGVVTAFFDAGKGS